MEQVQELEERQVTELDVMKASVDIIQQSVSMLKNVRDNFLIPMLDNLPVIERTPEEEVEYQTITSRINAEIENALAESRREDEARHAEYVKLRDHSRIMFAELPEGTCLSIHDVHTDYYARQAKAAAEAALL